jgi:AcrR family transcriptional regulator
MRIVLTEGLEGLAIARLARALGAAVGAIYRYFDSKEALITALQEQAIGEYGAALARRLAETDAALGHLSDRPRLLALTRLLLGFGYYLEDAEAAPLRHRLLDVMLSSPAPVLPDEEARRIEGVLAPILAQVARLLEAAVSAGGLAPGDALRRSLLLWAALHGLDHFRKRDRIQPPDRQVAALLEILWRTLLVGFGGQAAEVEAALEEWRRLRE